MMNADYETIAISEFEKMILTTDVAMLHKELVSAGMREIKAPFVHETYGDRSFVQDQSGVLIEIRTHK